MEYQQRHATKWAKAQGKEAAKSPTTADLAWAAGFLEGEGSFGVNRRALRTHACCVVRATQKTLEPLQKLQRLFGGSVGQSARCATKYPSNVYGEWRTYGARARGVMFTLFTFLSARRREQITVALSGGY